MGPHQKPCFSFSKVLVLSFPESLTKTSVHVAFLFSMVTIIDILRCSECHLFMKSSDKSLCTDIGSSANELRNTIMASRDDYKQKNTSVEHEKSIRKRIYNHLHS